MRALVITPERGLTADEQPEPPLAPGQARVRVRRCGVCGTDVSLLGNPAAAPAGTILGHEIAGDVVELASDVEGWRVGDRVAIDPINACRTCEECRAGRTQVCAWAAEHGIGDAANPGGFAETIVVPVRMLELLPDGLGYDAGALVEPFAVGVHAVARAGCDPAVPVCVLGAGPIGLMTAYALRARGFERVVVVSRGEHRRLRAERLGFATVALDAVGRAVPEALGGVRAAAVFEASGSADGAGMAVELVAPGGVVVALGAPRRPVEFPQRALLLAEVELRGSLGFTRAEFAEAAALLAAGRLPVAQLVTAVATLDDAASLIAQLAAGDADHVKVQLAP